MFAAGLPKNCFKVFISVSATLCGVEKSLTLKFARKLTRKKNKRLIGVLRYVAIIVY
jgi:hypothetical protein